MKTTLLALVEDQNLPLLGAIVSFIVAGSFLLVWPPRIRSKFFRYVHSLLWVLAWIVIITIPIDLFLDYTKAGSARLGAIAIFLAIIAVSIAFSLILVRRFESTYPRGAKKDPARNIGEAFWASWHDFLMLAIIVAPVVAFNFMRVLALQLSYSHLDLIVVVRVACFAIIEEYAFRYMLPKLSKSNDCQSMDYVVFSIAFQCMHLEANTLLPLFFSLYSYFVIRKTGRLRNTVLAHAVHNYLQIAFV